MGAADVSFHFVNIFKINILKGSSIEFTTFISGNQISKARYQKLELKKPVQFACIFLLVFLAFSKHHIPQGFLRSKHLKP